MLRVMKTYCDSLSLWLQWKTLSKNWYEKPTRKNNNNNNNNNNNIKNLLNSELCRPIRLQRKLKENKKRDKYWNLAREQRKLWNMKVIIIPIVFGALNTVLKGLVKGLEDLKIRRQMETIQTTALLRSPRILRRALGICCHSKSSINHQLMLVWKILKGVTIIITLAAAG